MEEEYEVPSPHERAVEEAGENRFDSLVQKVALMTAILATIGALISYQSGSAQRPDSDTAAQTAADRQGSAHVEARGSAPATGIGIRARQPGRIHLERREWQGLLR